MLTVPWIINNMISEPEKTTKLRRPSEIEMKVQKSLQQLTIPDWYTNKCRASPRIITDRRPIESRPAPWKDNACKRIPLLDNPRKDAVPNTAVVRPVPGNNEASLSEWDKLNELRKSLVMSRDSHISKTFPKISPSRKIQNINIVFPTSATTSDPAIRNTGDGESAPELEAISNRSKMSVDSLDEFGPEKMSSLRNETMSICNTVRYPVKNPTAKTLTFKDSSSSKMLKNNCQLPATALTTANSREDFNSQNVISEKNAQLSTPSKFYNVEKMTGGSISSVGGFSTPVKKINTQIILRTIDPSSCTVRNSSSSNESTESLKKVSPTTHEKLFSTPRKSTEMENIIKSNQSKRSNGKSFVEEIIKELNAKCSPKIKSNYVSPASKNFVKKLVRALEMGCAPINDGEISLESSYTNVDTKPESEPLAASISGKDSDSGSGSDSEPKPSRSSRSSNCSSPFRSFSRALEDREIISRASVTPYVDDEDESVYWIPLPTCKLPRTSSLKNMMSRLSSPTSSPVPEVTTNTETNSRNPEPSSGWGKTFNKGQPRSRQLFRIDETTVVDSGYSDRSGTNSSSSSVVDESWYDDSEITRTASERSDDSDNGYSNSLQSFELRMLRSRQRTSVV